jgi:hypothetical protein
MRCLGSCLEPHYNASRVVSIGDSKVEPRSGERAWFYDPKSGQLFEKYLVNVSDDPQDGWLMVCNECIVPVFRNGLQCVGKTVASAVLGMDWPAFEGVRLEELPVDYEWERLRQAEPALDWMIANPDVWNQTDQGWHLKIILQELKQRLDEVNAGTAPTTLVRWRAREQRVTH